MDLSNENVIHKKEAGIEYLQFRKLLEYKDNITHAFTIGIDKDYRMPLYNSTQNRLTKEQIEENKNNYKKICKTIGIEYNDIVKTNQVHKDIIKNIDKKINIGSPDFCEKEYAETDGLITNKTKLAICATCADCIIMMMYDKKKKVVANVHSGWRGTVQKVAEKTICKMEELYNCNPKDIICCISPSIRNCHFELGEDVKNIFEETFTTMADEIIKKQEKWYIHTVKLNIEMLKSKGLKEENIVDSKICTVCNSNLIHSYRGSNNHNGLEIGIIELK